MDFVFFDEVRKKPYLIPALIGVISVAVILLNAYGIELGITYVLPHLFYIPIILAAYYYPRRGVLFAICLSACYGAVAFMVITPTTAETLSAIARCGVFVLIAVVVSYLSGRMHHDTQMCRRLVSVVRSSGDAIIGETPEGIVTDWNFGAEQLYGYTSEEMMGTSVFRFIPPERQEEKRRLLEKIRHGETIERVETERITKDNRRIQIFLSSSPIINSFGEIIGISEIAHDITEQKRAGVALRESEQKYRTLFENMLEGFAYCRMIYDNDDKPADWEYLDVNTTFAQLTGLHDIKGRRVLEAIPGIRDLTPELFDTYSRVASTGISETFEINFKPLKKWLNVSAFSPQKGYFVAVFDDITERKQAEGALRESEEKYRVLVENAQEGIAVVQDHFFVFFNDWLPTVSGYSPEELSGRPVAEFAVEEEREKVRTNHLLQIRGTKLNEPYIVRIRIKSGEIRWIDIKSTPIAWRGSPATLNFYTDITERRKILENLRKAEENYRNLVENSHEIIYRIQPDGILTFISPSWTRLLGHDASEVIGHDFRQFIHHEDIPACEEFLKKTVGTRKKQPAVEYRVFHKDGSVHWHRSNIIPVFDEPGTGVSFVGNAVDFTGKKQANDALALANRKLSLLSSITRHDIRNQLMALGAYIELSRDAADNPSELKDYIEKELRIADAIARQISFTKDYEDLGVKSAVWQDVDSLVRNAAKVLPVRDIRLESGCNSLEVFADPLLEKVFYNLIDNSLKYGGEKMTTIRVISGEPGTGLRIVYSDDGNGISADDKTQLFSRGFGKHTGLGLFLSREILSITGITITENGEPGTGARFVITVPDGAWRFTGATQSA
ncbi:PAS domain S-box protein [uncultured Methanoregula sp.]|uniref:PAS domain-containing protein n=1 Tax=uncultured Methanoregula sp. TaxID=1005933 RepID=UPI002AAAF601|nr:PAS domain S-box protein [uncultured Methanoregula sp.]